MDGEGMDALRAAWAEVLERVNDPMLALRFTGRDLEAAVAAARRDALLEAAQVAEGFGGETSPVACVLNARAAEVRLPAADADGGAGLSAQRAAAADPGGGLRAWLLAQDDPAALSSEVDALASEVDAMFREAHGS